MSLFTVEAAHGPCVAHTSQVDVAPHFASAALHLLLSITNDSYPPWTGVDSRTHSLPDVTPLHLSGKRQTASRAPGAGGNDIVQTKHVARELGYRSTSAFHRAFKRWMGSRPSAYVNDARTIDGLQ